jgi:hypothetical protein
MFAQDTGAVSTTNRARLGLPREASPSEPHGFEGLSMAQVVE